MARRVILACALLLLPVAAARAADDAQLHGTITPPGADSRHATAEVAAYDNLVQGYPSLTEEELRTRYFKQRIFGPITDAERTYSPRAGVTVYRDARWGEPAIYGDTDEDMAFGAGYVSAEDRLAIMELLRALGRAEAFELLGTTPAWLADAEIARLYGYTVRCIGRRARARVVGPDRARVRRVRYRRARGAVRAKITMRSGQPRRVRLKRKYRPC